MMEQKTRFKVGDVVYCIFNAKVEECIVENVTKVYNASRNKWDPDKVDTTESETYKVYVLSKNTYSINSYTKDEMFSTREEVLKNLFN